MPNQTRPASRRIAANVGTGLAIRDDGQLVPSTPRILAQPNIRPYHGDPNWDLAQRLRYLAGLGNGRRTVIGMDLEPFNMRTATKEEILEFMDKEYGVQMDARKDHDTIRAEAISIIKREDAAATQHEQQAIQSATEMAEQAARSSAEAHAAATRDAQLAAASVNAGDLAKQEREELMAARAARAKARGAGGIG